MNIRKRTLLKLTCCFETSYKNISFKLSIDYLKKLFNFARNDNCHEIKLTAAKAISKLTKLVSGHFEQNHLKDLIPALKEMLYIDVKIGISICISLSNIIKNHGDPETKKSNSKILFIILFKFNKFLSKNRLNLPIFRNIN